jgi:HEAT repeat protein
MKASSFLAWLAALSLLLLTLTVGCGQKGPQVNVGVNTQDLKSTDTDKKVNACTELAKAGPQAAGAVPDLIPLLKDKDPLVRSLSAYALGQIGPAAKAALPALREAMSDSDPQVPRSALNALRAIGETNVNFAMPNAMTGPGGNQ